MKGINVVRDGPIPQVELYHLGGLKVIAGRLTFYVGFLNLTLIVPTAYNTSPYLQAVFPNVFVFSAIILVLLGIASIVEFGVIYPSQLKFSKTQSAKNHRDPIYREVQRLHDRLDEFEEAALREGQS